MTAPEPIPPSPPMKVVPTGKCREARGYLSYVAALLFPGRSVPVYEQPTQRTNSLDALSAEDQELLVEEGRRQLERQAADVGRNHTRAATLLTVTIAELVFLANAAPAVLTQSWLVILPWGGSVGTAVLALAGTASVLTSSAVYGFVDTADLADTSPPLLAALARRYVDAVGIGEATNAARLTVLRDGVWLAVLAGLLLVIITPFIT